MCVALCNPDATSPRLPSDNAAKVNDMSLKRYAELGTVHRTEPCQEYPGEWLLFFPWAPNEQSYGSYADARDAATKLLNKAEDDKREYDPKDVSICWKCSDNDPRVGQVWFTGFYCHGRFNLFGSYVTT